MPTSFHSVAYFANSEQGHFYHYHKSLQKALEPHVDAISVYVPIKASYTQEPQNWKKWFHPFFNKKNRKKFWKDCVRLFRQPSKEKRIFFLEFFGRRDFLLYSLAATLFSKKNDHIWILYRDDLETRRKKDQYIIYYFSKLLQWKCKARFVPLTDSDLLAEYYEPWFKKKVTVLPIPHVKLKPFSSPKNKKLTCAWLGPPRPEKGEVEIAELVEIEDPMSANIILEISGATYFPPVKNQVEVRLKKVYLTEEEYYASLFESDVILLPYDAYKYKRRTSGIFVESILAEKVPLVKEGSWPAYELNRFGLNELIVEWGKPGFFTDLFSLIQDETIMDKLKRMQQAYQEFHGEKNYSFTLNRLLSTS